jgi:selenoprotein W-related protein
LAVELERLFGITPGLIRGGGGIFDVRVDGELVFSKFRAGRFPETGEVARAIRDAVAP